MTLPDAALSGWKLTRFSLVALPVAAAGLPLAVYVPAIYAREFGLSLSAIGAVFLAGSLWGGLIDPVVGALSDRTRSRFGRRKPWIATGSLVFTLAALLLFFPVTPVTPLYLAAVLLAFHTGLAAVQIPFLAWSGEVSGRYHQRTRIATYQTVVTAVALLAVLVLPTIADQLRPGDGKLQLALMGGLVLATAIPTVALSLTTFREAPPPIQIERFSLGQSLRAVFANPLLLKVLASDFAVTAGQATRSVLIVFFVTFYMGRPEWAAGLFLFQFIFGVLAGPIWLRIGLRLGKHRTAVLGELVQVAINLALLTVTPDRFELLLALTLAQGLAQGSGNLMLRAIVADVADHHRAETGEERSGLYFSVFGLASKAGGAAAVGIALPLLAWFGFSATGTNSPEALNGLLLIFAVGPAIGHALSAALLIGFPLDERAHSEIRARLEDGPTVLAPAE